MNYWRRDSLKIIFVLHSHKLGGAEKHLLILSEMLKNDGHEVVFAGPRDSWLSEKLSEIGVETYHIPMHGFYDLYSLTKLISFTKRFKPDIIHGHLTRGAFYAGLASRFLKIPSVATAHSTNTWKHFQRVNKIVCVSKAVKEFLIKMGYNEQKLKLIYNGVKQIKKDISLRRKTRERLNIQEDEVVFGMIARVIHEKGHDLALDAFEKIGRKGKVLFVGDFNTEFGSLIDNKINKMGLNEKVIRVGQQDDILPYISAIDIYLSPSRREAISLSILESLSAGLPVIGSNVGGIPEAVFHGENGFIFENENVQDLANYMDILYNDQMLMEKFSKNATQVFMKKFDVDIMYREIISVYKELLH